MAANVQFKRGLLANLPQTYVDGTIYVTTDEHAMYLDQGNQRIRIGDFIPVNTVQDLPVSGHAYETAVYYVKQDNILARWDSTNSRWIQINKAGVVGVRQNGSGGNVITDVTTTVANDGTLQLLVTKATVATSEELESLIGRVTTLEGKTSNVESYITVLKGDSTVAGSLAKLAADTQAALLGNETTYTTLKLVGDKLRSLDSAVDGLENDMSAAQTAITALQGTTATHTSQLATINGDDSTVGSIAYAVKQEADARATLADRVSTNESDISSLTGRVSTNEAAIATLNGTGAGSVQKQVADAVASIVADAPTAYDTLKEVSDWISSHGTDAATMNSNITTLLGDVGTLQSDMTTAKSDISGLKTRMTTAEGNITNLQSSVTLLEGDSRTVGSVDYKIEQVRNELSGGLSGDISDLTARVVVNEGKLATIQGTGDGSITKAVGDERTAREAADTALDTRMTTAEGNITTLQSDMTAVQGLATSNEDHLTWKSF